MMNTLGETIYKLRTDCGLSQKQLAKKLGWKTAQLVSNIERGKASYPVKSLKKLSKIFNCNIHALIAFFNRDQLAALEKEIFGDKAK